MSSSKLVSVAIDFGTTFSGYAFSFRHNKENIQTYLWRAQNYESPKTPTCILFNPLKQFHSFGLEAEDKYGKLSRTAEAESWYFFKQFKLALYNTKTLERHTMLKENGKKEMQAIDVFSESIRYLKEHALEELARTGAAGISHKDIQWVLTVPAIWDDSAKQFMRLAAEKAGIQEKDLTLALEPEAASVYCRTLETEANIFQRVGTEYMVLDCGGGTVDIAIHRVQANGKLKAIYRPSGGVWGGTKVDDEFQAFLLKLCGMPAIRSLSKHDMIEIQRAFENVKAKVTSNSDSFIHLKLPIDLLSSVKTGIYFGKLRLIGDKLSLSPDILRGFFGKSIEKINHHIRTLLHDPELSGVKHIFMVGGFSLSEVLQDAVKREFPRLDVRSVVHANSAVLRGAVIYGHEPKIIKWRKCAYTYGVEVCNTFIEGEHDRNKKRWIDGVTHCEDIFDKLISINDALEVSKHRVTRLYTPLTRDQSCMWITFFRSTEAKPKYTTDMSCTKIGTLKVDMPDLTGGKTRTVKLIVEFGDTELKVEAIDQNTNVKFTAAFDFMSN